MRLIGVTVAVLSAVVPCHALGVRETLTLAPGISLERECGGGGGDLCPDAETYAAMQDVFSNFSGTSTQPLGRPPLGPFDSADGWYATRRTPALACDGTSAVEVVVSRVSPGFVSSEVLRLRSVCSADGRAVVLNADFRGVTPEGRLLLQVEYCTEETPQCPVNWSESFVWIAGLPSQFDVLTTFTPTGEITIGPARFPEGILEPVVAQDLLLGDVRVLPDYSATTRTCDVVTAPSLEGPTLLPDPLPTPGPGQALFYLVASRSASEVRLGRRFFGGALRAREVGLLSPCL